MKCTKIMLLQKFDFNVVAYEMFWQENVFFEILDYFGQFEGPLSP